MGLAENRPIAFIPTQKPRESREFYEKTLGLRFESTDPFATVYRIGPAPGIMLRVTPVPDLPERPFTLTPRPFTEFGWQVDDIVASVKELVRKGVEFERYDFLKQDELGIWLSPIDVKVAWFKDPDGNMLSLSQHPI
jgi:catechol 2,3-dioxygenase-like lactoylglutathione lyase family enzyme